MSDQEPAISSELAPRPIGQRLRARRDRLIHAAATGMIKLGKEMPRLKEAGYWIYGTATRFVPRGRDVAKLGAIGPTVLRGAQPSLRAFRTLREMGVETVINLRPESDHERPIVEKLGLRYLYMPLPPLDAPTHELTLSFLHAVTNPGHGTVFFHCFHGVDRTGTMAACLRIARDDWSVDEALAEMRAYKLHEHGQRAKVDYLHAFHAHWHALSERERCEALHRPLPDEEPAAALPWWARAVRWASEKLASRKQP